MDWDHGYYAQSTYTCGFYRETAPNWIDFSALVKGLRPPRRCEGSAFHYLDLGCGMGFSLCLMAALYPEGQFIGVDFQPDHIAHSQWLANELNLANIRFLEADFLSLNRDPSALGMHPGSSGLFHYVVSHGVATWVTEPVQEALLALASRVLVPGGLFYCSYNTMPGWQPLANFHHLVQLQPIGRGRAKISASIKAINERLQLLVGKEDNPTPLGRALPNLKESLAQIAGLDERYLIQEYCNTGWQPLYVADMHGRCRQHKLCSVSTATLPELFPALLPASIHEQLLDEPDPEIRESLIDLVCFKCFRRDVFAKGTVQLTPQQREEFIGKLRCRQQEAPSTSTYHFSSSFGELRGDPDLYGSFEHALSKGPLTIAELSLACNQTVEEVLLIAALLLHKNRIGLDRERAGDNAMIQCVQINERIRELMMQGYSFSHLTAPRIGNGVGFNHLEVLITTGLEQGLKDDFLSLYVLAGMESLSMGLKDQQGLPMVNSIKQAELVLETAKTLSSKRLDFLRKLGVVTAITEPECQSSIG